MTVWLWWFKSWRHVSSQPLANSCSFMSLSNSRKLKLKYHFRDIITSQEVSKHFERNLKSIAAYQGWKNVCRWRPQCHCGETFPSNRHKGWFWWNRVFNLQIQKDKLRDRVANQIHCPSFINRRIGHSKWYIEACTRWCSFPYLSRISPSSPTHHKNPWIVLHSWHKNVPINFLHLLFFQGLTYYKITKLH